MRGLGDEAGAELHLQALQLVAVQVLLHQVALALDPRLHVRGHVGDQPGHEELDHEDHVLQEKQPGQGVQVCRRLGGGVGE